MPGTAHDDKNTPPRHPAMARQKTRDAFMAKTSVKAKLLAEDKTSSTSLEVCLSVQLLKTTLTPAARVYRCCCRRGPEQLN